VRSVRVGIILALLLSTCDTSAPTPQPLDAPPSTSGEPAGDCSATTVGRATVIRFAAEGACVPGDVLVLYRCTPAAVPVLRVSSAEGAALFLGGRFAVPVDSLPANVRFAGSAGGTEVLIADPIPPSLSPSAEASASPEVSATTSPAAPATEPEPLVYVRRAGVTERWLRLQGKRDRRYQPAAWAIGDSILDGGREIVEERLAAWDLTLDAEVGRSSSSAPGIVHEAVDGGADVVVVELGTNDSSAPVFREHLFETLDTLIGVPLVVWQTLRGPADDTTIPELNTAIRQAAAEYPNVSIADWEAFVPEEAVQTDGIHPDEDFLHLEADLIVPLLKQWRAALTRDGATACGGTVLRETS
jgi:hypothetical protein